VRAAVLPVFMQPRVVGVYELFRHSLFISGHHIRYRLFEFLAVAEFCE